MRLFLSIALLAAAWTAGAQGTSEGIVSHFNPSPVTPPPISSTAGWSFQPTNFIALTQLGCFNDLFVNNSTIGSVQVGLWTSGGMLLASNLITRSSTLFNESRYESVTAVGLDAGQVYTIGAYSPDGPISIEICGGVAGGTVITGTNVLLRAPAINALGFGFPAEVAGQPGAAYLGPNFRYQGNIPEPAAGMLLGLGALILAARRRTGSC